ncbi:MAG: hypothetical protein HZA58_09875 [Acidimicrobiia bacterium]|nr:hypothetical protein [Acidimicrobiia bacterium]
MQLARVVAPLLFLLSACGDAPTEISAAVTSQPPSTTARSSTTVAPATTAAAVTTTFALSPELSAACAVATGHAIGTFGVSLDSVDANSGLASDSAFYATMEALFGEVGDMLYTECGLSQYAVAISDILRYLVSEKVSRAPVTAALIASIIEDICLTASGQPYELTFEGRAVCLAA